MSDTAPSILLRNSLSKSYEIKLFFLKFIQTENVYIQLGYMRGTRNKGNA
jgi:hypothetical protein